MIIKLILSTGKEVELTASELVEILRINYPVVSPSSYSPTAYYRDDSEPVNMSFCRPSVTLGKEIDEYAPPCI